MLKLFLSEVSQSINTCVINILIFSFFNKVYGKKYQSRILYGVAYIGAVTAMILVNQIQIAPVNLLYTIVYMDVLSVWLFRADFKKFWLYNLIFFIDFIFLRCHYIFFLVCHSGRQLRGNHIAGRTYGDQQSLEHPGDVFGV